MTIQEIRNEIVTSPSFKYQNAPYYHNSLMTVVYFRDEVFKPFIEIPNHYMISNFGKVYSRRTGCLMKPTIDKDGYCIVGTYDNSYNHHMQRVHRMIMMTFEPIENPEEMQVNHMNGIKSWNIYLPGSPDHNLEWVTQQENITHGYSTGLMAVGERVGGSFRTEKDIRQICELLQDNPLISAKEIVQIMPHLDNGHDFGSYIAQIRNGKLWKHITKDYKLQSKQQLIQTDDETVHKICQGLIQGLSHKEIAQSLGRELTIAFRAVIDKIKKGEHFTRISSQYGIQAKE